jgi:hypothetical protein
LLDDDDYDDYYDADDYDDYCYYYWLSMYTQLLRTHSSMTPLGLMEQVLYTTSRSATRALTCVTLFS